jgi:hypothetical protein
VLATWPGALCCCGIAVHVLSTCTRLVCVFIHVNIRWALIVLLLLLLLCHVLVMLLLLLLLLRVPQ